MLNGRYEDDEWFHGGRRFVRKDFPRVANVRKCVCLILLRSGDSVATLCLP
jgi:hypothetical protein